MKRLRAVSLLLALVFGGAIAVPVAAQERFPVRPIKLVVGYPPGGSVDVVGRILADGLSQKLDAQVVVENVGGAAGAIGAARVATSAPDGYTLLVGSSNELVGTGVLNPEQKYDAQKDFTPIGLVASAPLVLVAGPKSGVKTLPEFVELARRNPGKFSYGSPGMGSTMHFAGELTKQQAGLFITHIPYRGTTALTTDLLGSVVEFGFMSPTVAAPHVQSGRLIGLGVSARQRLPAMPQVPALTEHPALAGYELIGWIGLAGPRNMSADVVAAIDHALKALLQDPAFRKKLQDVGGEPASGREDFAKLLKDETDKYLKLAAFAKLR
ncbi:tripartite tricarboxylate transporter substrate binding protein [Ramlibacter sp. WS9]|uniref:Bug family tripartite tricarboxylate transporter substrate binding protein n=1 Tax=Ramlibacter sp. WS9 TaxID=1882741 RepID=UPI0011432013|nr:tripartite tricarboxylate transporter substrate binding protein [Ramlibacter sp. WS9]ROZ68946.1 tripartite tricarboxylate transporter substrate binding protein [Ramlibacter sp. WS9]